MCSFVRYESGVEGGMISLSEMRAFLNHPYHVEKDAAMLELVDSIQTEGVLVPLLIRPVKEEGYRFEIISGRRRKMAAEMAGLSEVPAIIRKMDDDQAVIAMTDSNLHREHIKPSEKAFAYREATDRMGKEIFEIVKRMRRVQAFWCLHFCFRGGNYICQKFLE